jgi:hypothetical protein
MFLVIMRISCIFIVFGAANSKHYLVETENLPKTNLVNMETQTMPPHDLETMPLDGHGNFY